MLAHFASVPAWAPRFSTDLPDRLLISDIQRAVAAHYGLPVAEMRSARRAWGVSRPRQVAMYLAARLTPRTLPEIGRRFGGRDHTTVIHAVKATEARRRANPDLDRDIRILTAVLAPMAAALIEAQGAH